jgi:hypothetical protein
MPFKIWPRSWSTKKYKRIEAEDKFSKRDNGKATGLSLAEVAFAIFMLLIIAVPSYLAGVRAATKGAEFRSKAVIGRKSYSVGEFWLRCADSTQSNPPHKISHITTSTPHTRI